MVELLLLQLVNVFLQRIISASIIRSVDAKGLGKDLRNILIPPVGNGIKLEGCTVTP